MSLWRINNWTGGISTGSKKGIDGSFYFGQGMDFRTDPDLLQTNYTMVKDSSTNVTDLIKWFAQYNTTIYAYGDTGKIYSNASSWTSLRTVSGSTGQGLAVFRESSVDGLYYAQSTQLGRYADLSGTPSFTDNYKALNADVLWHPMKTFLNFLCVGNGNTLATLDSAGVWEPEAITLPFGWKIKSLEVKGDLLFIGGWKGTAITDYEQGALFSWDGTSLTWNSVEYINESGINSMFNQSDALFISAGTRGNIYQYTGGKFFKIKKIPFIGTGKVAEVYPGAMTGYNGIVHIGAAGSTTSTTLNQGIYTWGQAEKNYPMVLNFDYPISTGTIQGTALSIGAVFGASPTKLYVGWKDGATYGIDLISTTTKQTTLIYESLIYDAKTPYTPKLFKEVRLLLPSGTAVVKYKADRAANYTTLTLAAASLSTTNYLIYPLNDATGFIRCNELQVRIEVTGTQQLVEAAVDFDFEEV